MTSAISMPLRFGVPQHGMGYPSVVLSRSLDLIERGIWAGMKAVRLRRWMKNFDTEKIDIWQLVS